MRITRELYDQDPTRYTIVRGDTEGAPFCPYGHCFQWVGYDLQEKAFVRFTKSVFKHLVQEKENVS